jgi:hypothetical protein
MLQSMTQRLDCMLKGLSINDVTFLGGGGQEYCNDSTKALVIKCMTMEGGGVKNCQK